MHSSIEKIFVVFDNSMQHFVSFGNKVAWKSSAAAKNAVMCNGFDWKDRPNTFDEQELFEVFEVELIKGNE